jgi:hypothetical protein
MGMKVLIKLLSWCRIWFLRIKEVKEATFDIPEGALGMIETMKEFLGKPSTIWGNKLKH